MSSAVRRDGRGRRLGFSGALLLAIAGGGCAVTPDLYAWGGYEAQVYQYFQNEPPEQQIQALEAQLRDTAANGQKPPPGLYAHLGLLYSKVGNTGATAAMFAREKQLYPESAVFLTNIANGFKDLK
ncbi:MAG: DUF4810 domain-containing protein [Burkholderiaceae bacterium]